MRDFDLCFVYAGFDEVSSILLTQTSPVSTSMVPLESDSCFELRGTLMPWLQSILYPNVSVNMAYPKIEKPAIPVNMPLEMGKDIYRELRKELRPDLDRKFY